MARAKFGRNTDLLWQRLNLSVKYQLDMNMEKSCSQIGKECRLLTVHGSKGEITPLYGASLWGLPITASDDEIEFPVVQAISDEANFPNITKSAAKVFDKMPQS